MHKLNYRFNHNKQRQGVSYKAIMGTYKKMLPSCVDLRNTGFVPAIENQGDEGDCAAHATAGGIEFLQMMNLKTKSGPFIYAEEFNRVSRQQLYWGGRLIEGSTGEDSGISDLMDMATVCQQTGVAAEILWPYIAQDLFNPPPQNVLDNAAQHKLPNAYALSPGYQLKHCIWSGYPFMLGFQVFESFMTEEVAKTGEMPLPMEGEKIVGGHAVLAVGYDDARSCFIVRNSWGGQWGIDGYFHMPYEFIDSQYAGDFVTLRAQAASNP